MINFVEKIKKWLCIKSDGEIDVNRSMMELNLMRTLASRDTSFSVIGIRCNSEKSIGKRKMTAGMLYQFLQGYEIGEDYIIEDGWRVEQNRLYDDYYTELTEGKPHIQISAIVGQNGAGKSSIVEFMMRLINNFAASTLGEYQHGGAAERLHFVDGIDGELWYMQGGFPYRLMVKNAHVTLHKFASKEETERGWRYTGLKEEYNNGLSDEEKELKTVLEQDETLDLKEKYSHFFYTLISNQSIYAYNTMDFELECNSDEKECEALGDQVGTTYSVEDRNWLHGIFHKNDGYKTPMVITPFRREGNMDINKENLLAMERLVTLLALQKNLRLINGHLKAESLRYSYEPGAQHGQKALNKLGYNHLTEKGYIFLRTNIVKCWEKAIGRKIEEKAIQRPYGEAAIDYLVYKTLKVTVNYEQHGEFYKAYQGMTDSCPEEALMKMVKKESEDLSHITRKLFQTIAFIWYEVYVLKEEKDGDGHYLRSENVITFDALGQRWHEKTIKAHGVEREPLLNYIQRCALILPQFLCMDINLCDVANENVKIEFESLSSGERQQIYSISSLLYHLDNLKSVAKDESNPERIQFKHVNIVLEEIELYYHPEMQQQFVRYLMDGLDQMDLEGLKSVNVMIVTHSPYVLSDIPRGNVLALKKNEEAPVNGLQTFGANIHDLLKNSFFLTDGAMGNFARWEVSHLKACMNIHRWARQVADKTHCPFLDEADEKPAYRFLQRYTMTDYEHKGSKLFSFEHFAEDFSEVKIKSKIQLLDEPVIYQILMREFSELFPGQREESKQLMIARLQQQIDDLNRE